jgi:hypothetical protein
MKKWKDDEVRVAWGVPINPSYLDGIYAHTGKVVDRYGKRMNYSDVARLNKFRVEAREQWRLDNKDTIKNMGGKNGNA